MSQSPVDLSFYQTLLESTKAIPWQFEWGPQRFSYIGPQIETLLGWPQASWQSAEDWAERIHPEDRQRAVEYCSEQSLQGQDHELDYRALTADGGYVWIRDVVHVVRDGEQITALMGFMFDISEQKKQEQQLRLMNQQLEQMNQQLKRISSLDGLTGIPNRRMFDQSLENEWRRCLREDAPLSLLLIDVDRFRDYNSYYGHLIGDSCLKQIALVTQMVAKRSSDMAARYSGEEFAVILPKTESAEAGQVAQDLLFRVEQLAMPHGDGKPNSVVTVSIGVATLMPDAETTCADLVVKADEQLYLAKSHGGNRLFSEGRFWKTTQQLDAGLGDFLSRGG